MREIKFRAWFTKAKAMVPVDDLNLMGGPGHMQVKARHDFEKGGWYTPLSEYTHKKTSLPPSTEQVPRVILMQFTGLHDKNGVEIYENDIVSDHVGLGVVEYHDSAYRVNYKNGHCKWFIDYSLEGERDSIEVIGNKFENPNLLEESK